MREQREKILVIDDDAELCELVTEYLETEGFDTDVVHDGAQGPDSALSGRYGLVILDVMLPQINGLEVLRRIRAKSEVPVLMLTARGDEVDRIVGLEVGADDYLPKPFNPRELVARIRAILRRTQHREGQMGHSGPEPLTLADIEFDLATRTVRRSGSEVKLTTVEFDLLGVFLKASGTVMKREELTERVLGRQFTGYDRSIDVHVSKLRRKLGRHAGGSERIKSIRGVGYIYVVPVGPKNE